MAQKMQIIVCLMCLEGLKMEEQIKKHVIIVDDSRDDRAIAKKILEKHNFLVSEAGTWLEALELLGKEEFDLVLLDLRMPDMDGMELLGIIRRDNNKKDLPVVVYSSYELARSEDKGEINGFIEKYCAPEEFIKSINKILGL